MYKIAAGIDVYYENKKEISNIIFFSNGNYEYYNAGEMLFEFISDGAIYLMTDKVENMIKAFPDYKVALTHESITEYFKWLYETVEDENMPVVTELFRSGFSEIIRDVLGQINSVDAFNCVGEFFMVCYKEYFAQVQSFAVFTDSISAYASGNADDWQKEVAEAFNVVAESYDDYYTQKCNVRHIKGQVCVKMHNITNLLQLLIFEICRLKKEGKIFKQCVNCGRYFIPAKRKDSIYCHEQSPQNSEKMCSEIGPQVKRIKKRKSDLNELNYHNNTYKLYNAVRRAKEKGDAESMVKHFKNQIEKEVGKYRDL